MKDFLFPEPPKRAPENFSKEPKKVLDIFFSLVYNMRCWATTAKQHGRLAQLVEHSLDVRVVSGSNPLASIKKDLCQLASGAKGQSYTNQPRQGVSLPRLLVRTTKSCKIRLQINFAVLEIATNI